jgi:hypothetical protein
MLRTSWWLIAAALLGAGRAEADEPVPAPYEVSALDPPEQEPPAGVEKSLSAGGVGALVVGGMVSADLDLGAGPTTGLPDPLAGVDIELRGRGWSLGGGLRSSYQLDGGFRFGAALAGLHLGGLALRHGPLPEGIWLTLERVRVAVGDPAVHRGCGRRAPHHRGARAAARPTWLGRVARAPRRDPAATARARRGRRRHAALCQLLRARRDLPLLRDGSVAEAIADSALTRATKAELEALGGLQPTNARARKSRPAAVERLRVAGMERLVVTHAVAETSPADAPAGTAWLVRALPARLFEEPARVLAWLARAAVSGSLPSDTLTERGALVIFARALPGAEAVAGGGAWRLEPPRHDHAEVLPDGLRVLLDAVGIRAPRSAPAPRARPDGGRFAGAVRDALQAFHRAHELRDNALLGSALLERMNRLADTTKLQNLARSVVEEMATIPAYAREARVLRVTFLEPSPKQQAAAAELGMPYGTYRHRLRASLAMLVDLMWQRELEARSILGERAG